MRHILMTAVRIVFLSCLMVALVYAQAVPSWQPNTAYAVGALVTFSGQEFKCIQAHTSEVGWEPPNVPALWQPVSSGAADFSLTAMPASQTVTTGGAAQYTIDAVPVNGFSGMVSLNASGLPSGATASFNPPVVGASGSSTLTLSTASVTPSGTLTLTITGTSGNLTHTATVTVAVNSSAPDFTL